MSNTGVAGLTLGGGFGYLTRRFGWTCDTVRSMDVVTADGRLVRASDTENADLFWGLRGGGGNFGIVTSFEFELNAVGPEIVGGAIAWPAAEAPRVLDLFRDADAEGSARAHRVAGLRKAPPAPWLASSIHGKNIVALFVCYSGPVEEGERLIAPIKALGSPVGNIVQRRTYVSQQNLLDATQPKGRRYYWKSEYLPGHDPDFLAAATEHASRSRSPHSAILMFPLDGPLNRLPAGHSPVGNRDAAAVVNIAGCLGETRGRCGEHRVGAVGMARSSPVFDRRHLCQLPHRRGRRRTDPGGVRTELRAAGRDQSEVGPDEPVPNEQERGARGGYW